MRQIATLTSILVIALSLFGCQNESTSESSSSNLKAEVGCEEYAMVIDNTSDDDWLDAKIVINGEYAYGPAPNLFKAHKTIKLNQKLFVKSDGTSLGVPPIKMTPCEDIKIIDIQATVRGQVGKLHLAR